MSSRSSTRSEDCPGSLFIAFLRLFLAFLKRGISGKNPLKFSQRFTNMNLALIEPKFAHGQLMLSGTLFDHQDRFAKFTFGFKVAKQKNGVGQEAKIRWRMSRRTNKPVLG